MNIIDLNSFRWQYEEIFLRKIYSFRRTEDVAPIIIDCGTNIGMSLIYFSTLFKDSMIYGFEADPVVFNVCNSNLLINNVSNVTLLNKAVWTNNDGIDFCSDGLDGGHIKPGVDNITDRVQKIPSLRLSDFLLNFESIDMLKIDIEGAELEVLIDCKDRLGHISNIFIEYHCDLINQGLHIILDILARNGFSYHIENLTYLERPFLDKSPSNSRFDMQINIYAKK